MVKVGVTETPGKVDYPRLMRDSGGMVVLFCSDGSGTVMYHNNLSYEVGHHSTNWGMQYFSDFNGLITLSNEG